MAEYDYSGYWPEKEEENKKRYYEEIYGAVKDQITFQGKICDIGGGSGGFLHFFGVKKALIVDISSTGISLANKRGYKTLKYDLSQKLPFKDKTFDDVLLFEILEHVKEPEKLFDEAIRIGKSVWVGQPNTGADGVHHLHRIYPSRVMRWIKMRGLAIEKLIYIPAGKGTIYRYLPLKKPLSKIWPDRFALMIVVKVKG